MTRRALAIAIALLALFAPAALAHSGTLTGTSTCDGWTAKVVLNHNVTPDRAVTIDTDLPGAVGIAPPGNHYDTSFGEIWSASGSTRLLTDAQVTLRIGTTYIATLVLEPPRGCQTPSPSPTETPTPTWTPAPSSSATPTPSTSPTPVPTPTPTAAPSSSASPTPSDAPSATPTGSQLAATGTPGLTPPPTSTEPVAPTDSIDFTPIVLIGLGFAVLGLLVRQPRRIR